MAHFNDTNKKGVAIIAVSCLILLIASLGVSVHSMKNTPIDNGDLSMDHKQVSASAKGIKTICQSTDYKQICEDALRKADANVTDPIELMRISFDVASEYISEGAKKSVILRDLEKDPRTNVALENCKEMLEFASNDLTTSSNKLGELEISEIRDAVDDFKVWISSAITYQETCLEGFENTTGDTSLKMKEALKTASKLTSNALAMVTDISSLIPSVQIPCTSTNKRLLQGDRVLGYKSNSAFMDYPTWIGRGKRQLRAANQIAPRVTVAKDGSGNYKTVNEALKQVPQKNTDTYVIYIKEGVYVETVVVESSMTNVMFLGDGPTKTRISGSLNFVDGIPTSKTATVAVLGDYFMAKDIGFENTAGAEKHQAVALRVQSDFSVFYNCHMDGYQDTLYVHTGRQFYRDCTISGTIEFIFGDAVSVFQNCKMIVRKPLDNQFCVVTAQGRTDRRQPSAIVIQGGKIMAAPEYPTTTTKTYLGRPSKAYSRTVIMESVLDSLIAPEGWTPWAGNLNTNKCFYGEFNNNGPGSSTTQRVQWPGIKKMSKENALKYTSRVLLGGDRWVPQKGVPYDSGMVIKSLKKRSKNQ